MEPRAKLTKALVQSIPYVKGGKPARIVRDAALRNFFLLVGVRSKTFAVQKDVRDADGHRRTVRRSLGHWEDGITCEAARQGAMKELAGIAATRGAPSARGGMTLREAIALFRLSAGKGGKPRAPKTEARYAQMERAGYLGDWMDRPLRSITREEAFLRHRELTAEIAAGRYAGKQLGARTRDGRQQADDVMRWFRAVWVRAQRQDEHLPQCPTVNVEWHRVKRERTAIPAATLPRWWAGVQAIPNEVRRDVLVFILLTGMRREAACAVRWSDVDLDRAVLHVPRPKGGAERAFDLPLTKQLVVLLRNRQKKNPKMVAMQVIPADALGWVFPAFSASGHVEEPREEIAGVPFTIHDLRRTFATVAESLDLPTTVVGALLNHRQPGGSVTAGYVAHEVDRLRAPMQQISDRTTQLCRA